MTDKTQIPESIFDLYKTDTNREVDGINHQVNERISFRLARAGGSNMKYAKTLEAKSRPYRRQIQEDRFDAEIANTMLIQTFAETVVLGWTGITDANTGKEVKFSVENCVALLTQLPDLFQELREVAGKSSMFRNNALEDDLGN